MSRELWSWSLQARSGGRRGAVDRGRDSPGPRHRLVQADIRDPGPGRHHHWSLHTPPPRHTGTHCPHCHTRPSDGHTAQNDPLFRSQSSLLGLRSLVTGSRSLMSPVAGGAGWLMLAPARLAVLRLSRPSLCLQAGQGQACL